MRLIVGLGNPGREYAQTRHNVGWWVVDHLADVWHLDAWRRDGSSLIADGRVGGTRVRLMKPQTFMNLSGAALRPYLRRATWSAANDLLVVVDEVALALGTFRLRARGSAGGHNGLKSVESVVASQEYARLRIGIRPNEEQREIGDLSNFVLDRFGKEERQVILDLMPDVRDLCESWVRDGVEKAMNRFNRKDPGESKNDDAG
ncbi:MAG: aminoacyl-tRNA hydrolase [Gemmatimonadaceae bacterium]